MQAGDDEEPAVELLSQKSRRFGYDGCTEQKNEHVSMSQVGGWD